MNLRQLFLTVLTLTGSAVEAEYLPDCSKRIMKNNSLIADDVDILSLSGFRYFSYDKDDHNNSMLLLVPDNKRAVLKLHADSNRCLIVIDTSGDPTILDHSILAET